jgi:ABC-2 type transport system permease protein
VASTIANCFLYSNAATALGNYAEALNASFGQNTGIGWSGQRQLAKLDSRLWYNPGLSNPVYFGSGALGMMLILYPALLGALATAKEYEMGTIIQAYASSLTAAQWIAGKALVYVLIGFGEFLICFGLGLAVFSYHIPSDPSVLLTATFLYLFAGVFFGMVMGNATGSQSAAIQGVQMGSFLLSLLLSGYLFAIANIPVQIRWLSGFLPATHYIQIVRNSILRDVGWQTSSRPMAALVALAVAFYAMNVLQMRRMQFKG